MGTPFLHAAIGDVLSDTRIPAYFNGIPSTRVPPLSVGDNFGTSVTGLGDLDGDGVDDIAVGAPFDDDGGGGSLNRGAVWIVFLNANGTVKSHAKIGANQILDGLGEFTVLHANDQFGWAVTNLGDLNGDGVTDIAVGAPGDDGTFSDQGAVYIIFLTSLGGVLDHTTISHGLSGFPAILETEDRLGYSVAGIGDLDLDGVEDLIVGVPGDNDGGTRRGAAYIVYLNVAGTVKNFLKISDTSAGVNPTLQDLNEFGSSVTNLGDLDGNGVQDLAVGAWLDADGGFGTGAVWVLLLQRTIIPGPFLIVIVNIQSVQKISAFEGNFSGYLEPEDLFGNSVAGLGDLDGDGIQDMAVGATLDSSGAVWLLFLNTDGTVKRPQKISELSGGNVPDLESTEQFGRGVAVVGDLDGDGGLELLVGSPFNDAILSSLPVCCDTALSNAGVVRILNLDPTPEADLQIVMTDGPDPVETGEEITYGITVTNQGPNQAETVVIEDSLPLGTTFVNASPECELDAGVVFCDFGTVLPQDSRQVQILLQASDVPSILTNMANVSTLSNDPNSTNDSATASTVVQGPNATADLELTMVPVMNPVDPNLPPQSPSFQLTVMNHGPDVATNVQMTNNLPVGTLLQSVSPTQGLCQGSGPISCELGTMDINSSVIVIVTLQQATVGVYSNGAGVAAEQTDSNFTNNQAVAIVTVTSCTQTWKKSASGTDWFNSNNWGKAVPGAGDSVCIPEDANITPVLTASTSIQNLSLLGGENGTPGLTINAGVVLNVAGDVLALQAIDGSGSVQITQSSAMIQGTFPHLITENDVSLSGTTLVSGNLTIARGELRLGQQQLSVLGNLTTLVDSSGPDGALGMRHPMDRVKVLGHIEFQGAPEGRVDLLSAGTLVLKGNFTQMGNALSFAANGTHTVEFQKPQGVGSLQTLTFKNPNPADSHFANVTVRSGAQVLFNSNVTALGTVRNAGTINTGSALLSHELTHTTNEATGVLQGSGVIVGNITNAGLVEPGSSPGTWIVNGNLELTSTSVLHLELGGLQAGVESDLLSVTGDVTLNGTLSMERINGFTPVMNDAAQVLSGNSVSGTFHTIQPAQVHSDLAMVPVIGPTDIQAIAQIVPVTQFDLVVATGGLGNGTVTSLPRGIECGNGQTFCQATFPAGTVVELFAQPIGADSSFSGWGGPGCAGVEDVRCTVSMTQTRQITATFGSNNFPNIWRFFPWKPFGPTVNTLGFGQALITWNANPQQDPGLLDHYNLYVSTESGNYQGVTPINVGTDTTHTLTGLIPGVTYFAVVTGVNNEPSSPLTEGASALVEGQQESALSEEVRFEATGGLTGWTVIDEGTPASKWELLSDSSGGEGIIQSARTAEFPEGPARLGTLLTHSTANCRPNYKLSYNFQASDAEGKGALGAIVRVNGSQTWYRLAVDWEQGVNAPRFRLSKRVGTAFSDVMEPINVVNSNLQLPMGVERLIDIEVIDTTIRFFSGGSLLGEVTEALGANPILGGAAFGLYSWRSNDGFFSVPTITYFEDPTAGAQSECAVLEVQQVGTGQGTVQTISIAPPDGASMPNGEIAVPGMPGLTVPIGTTVTLSALADAGFDFGQWSGDISCVAGPNPNEMTVVLAEDTICRVEFTGTTNPVVNLDIDGSGTVNQVDAAVLQRGLFGLEGAALMEPITECVNSLDRCGDAQALRAYIEAGRTSVFDPDGNGQASPTSDANLIQRYVAWKQAGETGDITALIQGVVAEMPGGRVISNDAFATAQAIVMFLDRYYPGAGQQVAAVGEASSLSLLTQAVAEEPAISAESESNGKDFEATESAELFLSTQGSIQEVSKSTEPTTISQETKSATPSVVAMRTLRVEATADSTLMAQFPHRNVGAQPVLQVGGKNAHHAVVQFLMPDLRPDQIVSAELVLTPYQGRMTGKRRSPTHPLLEVVRLTEMFAEGNGQGGKGKNARGKGVGVTWTCAVDANIRNAKADCVKPWVGGVLVVSKDSTRLPVTFEAGGQTYKADVTAWLRAALAQQAPHLALDVLPTALEQVLFYSKEGGRDNLLPSKGIPYLLIQIKEVR